MKSNNCKDLVDTSKYLKDLNEEVEKKAIRLKEYHSKIKGLKPFKSACYCCFTHNITSIQQNNMGRYNNINFYFE